MNVFFNFIDSQSNPLTGSKVTLRQYGGPVVANGNVAFNGPISQFTDANGNVTFNSVVPTIYSVTCTGPNFNNPPAYVKTLNETFYINVPAGNGTISGSGYILSVLPPPNLSGSYYAISASYATTASFVFNVPPAVSASYATTASFALNISPADSASYALTASYVKFAQTASYNPYPDIVDISASHHVGINQPSPQFTLDISGTIANSVGDLLIGVPGDNNIQIMQNAGFIEAGGVGIGLNFGVEPQYRLDIYGDVGNFHDGFLYIHNATTDQLFIGENQAHMNSTNYFGINTYVGTMPINTSPIAGCTPSQIWYDLSTNQPMFVVGNDIQNANNAQNPASNSFAGEVVILGKPYLTGSQPLGLVGGLHFIDVNNPAFDNRAFVIRSKTPSAVTGVDSGSYVCFGNRYLPGSPDADTTFAQHYFANQYGNVGLGDCGQVSDGNGLFPNSKVTIYGSPGKHYNAFQVIPLGYNSNVASFIVDATGNVTASVITASLLESSNAIFRQRIGVGGIINPGHEIDINTGSSIGCSVDNSFFIGTGFAQTYFGRSGSVGIGKSSPSFKLDVSGAINTNFGYLLNGLPYTASLALTASYNRLPDVTDNVTTNCVGINQTNPVYPLDVAGLIGNSLYGHNNYMDINNVLGDTNFNTFNNFMIAVNGGVGVNVGSPNYTLDVNGTTGDSNGGYYLLSNGGNSWINAGSGGNLGISMNSPVLTLDCNGPIGNSTDPGYQFAVRGNQSWINVDTGFGAGGFGIGNNNPQFPLDISGSIGNSLNDGFISLAGSSNSTLNFGTANGTGMCNIRFFTFGNFGNTNGAGEWTDTPSCTWNFTDLGNYTGQSIFSIANGGNDTAGLTQIMGIGSAGGPYYATRGVAIGVDYVGQTSFALPNNGLIIEGFVGIGLNNPSYQLDVSGDINFSGVLRKAGSLYIPPSSSYVSASNSYIKVLSGSQIYLNDLTTNAIEVYQSVSNYTEINITNTTASVSASADIVATNNTGSASTYYVNMGINSTNYNQNFVGNANDAYLFCTGSNMFVGNITPGKSLYLFTGGTANTSSVKIDQNGAITASKFVGTASLASTSSMATFQSNGFNIPIIQAGSASVSAASSLIIAFNKTMPNTNYVAMLTAESPISTPSVGGKTIGGFTASFALYTGNLDWLACSSTQ